jgi:hypothetical protein
VSDTTITIMVSSLASNVHVHVVCVSRQLGEIEIAEAWTDMLLTNSRTIFARVRALSIDPKTIGKSYEAAYTALLACQGTNVSSVIMGQVR